MPRPGRTQPLRADTDAPARRVAVIVSRYNASVTDRLRDGAMRVIASRLGEGAAEVIPAPGAYELPALALVAAEAGAYAGVVAVGCLIKGETRHDRYIAEAVAHGLMEVTLKTGVPVAFGVITAETPRQARDRAGGKNGNKGEEAATALLDTLDTIEAIRDGAWARFEAAMAEPKPDKARSPGAGGRTRKVTQK